MVMITKTEFLAALATETKILSHLAAQLKEEHLAYRFTPEQRSTLELLQYLTINLQAFAGFNLVGTWDHWDALDAKAKDVTLATFPAALKKQLAAMKKLLLPISDRAFGTKLVKPVMGKGTITVAAAMQDILTFAAGYRMQLFLQTKAAGVKDIGSSDLWLGKKPAPKKAK